MRNLSGNWYSSNPMENYNVGDNGGFRWLLTELRCDSDMPQTYDLSLKKP